MLTEELCVLWLLETSVFQLKGHGLQQQSQVQEQRLSPKLLPVPPANNSPRHPQTNSETHMQMAISS